MLCPLIITSKNITHFPLPLGECQLQQNRLPEGKRDLTRKLGHKLTATSQCRVKQAGEKRLKRSEFGVIGAGVRFRFYGDADAV